MRTGGYYLKKFAHYVSLNILSMIGLSLYILADTFFIAKGVGRDGLAALNIAIPVYNIINGAGLMLGIGGAARFAVFRVQSDKPNMNRVYTVTIRAFALISAFLFILGLLVPGFLSSQLGAGGSVYPLCKVYVRVLLLFSPAFILNNILNAFVKNDGEPALAMAAMLTGTIFNIVFDYILIFPVNLGMTGAVLATGFSPVVGIIILSFHFIRHKNSFAIESFHSPENETELYQPGKEKPVNVIGAEPMRGTLIRVFSLGAPSLISELAVGVSVFVFNTLMLHSDGNTGVAAYGVIANVYIVIQSIFTGVAQGSQPVFSEAAARNDRAGFRTIRRAGLVLIIIMSIVIYGMSSVFASDIVSLFNKGGSAKLSAIAVPGIKIYFSAMIFMGINTFISMGYIARGLGRRAQVIMALRGFFILVPMAYILSRVYGTDGVFSSLPVTEALTLFAAGLLALYDKRKERKRYQPGS
jgi:Na+-driven multidrug efflux pump